jgi:hypothetical protein
MNLIHLFTITFLALNFSGTPLKKQASKSPVQSEFITSPVNETEEYIAWTDDRLLMWEDFQCEPKTGTDAVASTSTSLGIAYQLVDGQMTYDITCNFSKVKSWGLMKTDYILAHEQGHFDITEVYARKLHEALQNYQFNKRTFKRDISEIYQSIVKQKEECQRMYDGESDHSRNRKIQYAWMEKIQKLLDETESFSAYP